MNPSLVVLQVREALVARKLVETEAEFLAGLQQNCQVAPQPENWVFWAVAPCKNKAGVAEATEAGVLEGAGAALPETVACDSLALLKVSETGARETVQLVYLVWI